MLRDAAGDIRFAAARFRALLGPDNGCGPGGRANGQQRRQPHLRVPGTRRRAVVRGFGAVYTGIDRAENTAFPYFDRAGRSLGRFAVPVGRDRLSFLGVIFSRPVVARVRIEYGSGPLGTDDGGAVDAAVMDDFIYREPAAPPR